MRAPQPMIPNDRFLILNPNTSGQGESPLHAEHALETTVLTHGYFYSHSVNVGALGGGWRLYHCYKATLNPAHSVSLIHGSDIWDTKTSRASGRSWSGKGRFELVAHLRSKARRYGLRTRQS